MAEESIDNPASQRAERIGKYEIVGHIATGGMGVIYKARDVDLDRLVALKVLPPDLAAQKLTLVRFQREAKAAARLRHENIVAIYDVGESNGTYYIALEYIEGTDLQDYITRKNWLDPDEALQIMIQATRALVHAHEQGIVHRDIKPSNFLLTQKDDRVIVKLTDFGLAIRHENDAEFRITKAKTTVGTVDYMAPEQARDSRGADIRSDIYSLGCTFFHMLAGNGPFSKGTLPERIIQHMKSPPPDIRKLNKAVPDSMVAILTRMLAKKADDRYQRPADLLDDLEHPERVVVPAKRGPAGKSERGASRRKTGDLAEPVAERNGDAEVAEIREGKPPRVKKPIEDRDQDIDDSDVMEDSEATPEPAARPDPGPKKKAGQNSQAWTIVTACSVGTLVLALIMVLIFGGRPAPVKPKDPEKPPAPPLQVEVPVNKKPPPIDTSPAKMTVIEPAWPTMDRVDRAGLRADFYGEFTVFPEAPAKATVLRVSRLAVAGPDTFRTLAAALAAAKPDEFTVIEIRDDGPIYIPGLPPVAQRNILVRGGDGHRPLLVWAPPKKSADPKTPQPFCTLAQGKLILDNIDFVMRNADDASATVFDLPESDFHARNCTFSLAGKAKEGTPLVRRQRPPDAAPAPRPTQTWLKRCYVRGPDMTLLLLHESPGSVLLEESLIVGNQHPLIDMRGRDNDSLDLACVRSTLVTGQVLLRWRSQSGKGISPPIAGTVLDTILSRDDTIAPPGDMIQLGDDGEPRKMSWRAANTVYAGWRQLLASGTVNIGGTDVQKWRDQFFNRDGDRAVPDTWPISPPSALEDQNAGTFLPQPPVAYAAATGAGSIGAVIGRLPPAPESWIERTFEPRVAPGIAGVDNQPPAVDRADDGLYHGELAALDLNRIDLGAFLNDKLAKVAPAPRVVLHLKGRGVCQMSPLRVQGVQHLVLYFERDFKEPVTLEPNPASSVNRAPLIEMVGGHLEVIGARIRLGPGTLVPTIIQIKGGSLTLSRSWLQGPFGKTPDDFQSLIDVANAGPAPSTLLLRDNGLIAGKLLIHLTDHVQLRARNNVFVGLGDGVRIEGTRPAIPLLHLLDHTTWAVRRAFFTFKSGPDFVPGGPVLIHANSNAFLRPFANDTDKGTLLRGADAWAAHGGLGWQGRFNVYDSRLPAYFTGPEKAIGPKQTLLDWRTAWGEIGEQDPLLFAGAAAKTIAFEGKTPLELLMQLDRLALPPNLRGKPDQRPPGADLVFMGLKKKG